MPGNFKYSRPRSSRPPVLPVADPIIEPLHKSEPLYDILARLDSSGFALASTEIDFEDGATHIPDEATFDALAHRDDVPGALGVREVKFLITGADTDDPSVYFLNTNNQKFHFFFARDVLGV
jgi:hypothetical protein